MPDTRIDPETPRELAVDGYRLRIEDVVEAGRALGARRPRLDESASARMKRSRQVKDALVAAGTPVYGVTSGFGDSSFRQVSEDKTKALQRNLISFLSCGSGPDAAAEVVRATLLIRANCLARGNSGVRAEVIRLLLDCLNADLLPRIPERGSVGASGDLVPLSYVASLLVGEGPAVLAGRSTTAADGLRECGLAPVQLVAKEGLALVNGTSFMTAFAALAANDAAELAVAAEVCTALSTQVLGGNPAHFAEFLYQHKPHPGAVAAAGLVRRMLGVGDLPEAEAAPEWDQQDGFRQLEHPIQDRYSIRCAPHVTGVLRDTLGWVRPWLEVEMNSSNDNPLFDPDGSATVFNGGNFYGGHVGQAMDALKIAAASVADLLDRQLELVVDEKFNNGLTPNLVLPVAPESWEAGLHHGFKGMQLCASSLAAEALKTTNPATSFSRSTEAHNQDKVSMGTIAARDARLVVDLSIRVAAIQLLALCQAADLRGAESLTAPSLAVHRAVRKLSATVEFDRPLEGDIEQVAAFIRSGELRELVGEEIR